MTTPVECCLVLGDRRVPYCIERTARRKTVALSVGPDGLRVLAPAEMDEAEVKALVQRKGPWVLQKLGRFEDLGVQPAAHEFVGGESFYYLGRGYRLRIERQPGIVLTKVKLLGGRLVAPVDAGLDEIQSRGAVRSGLKRWYQEHAHIKLTERVGLYAERLGVCRPSLLLRDQEKRWASCDKDGRIRVNWQLVMAPVPLIDYVMAHELCHLLEHNHSRRFWDLLEVILPDYELRRERLRREGSRYFL